MDEDLTPRKRTSRDRRGAAPWNVRLGLTIFFVIVTGGLVAFGAVDRAVQIPLIVLLGLGLAVVPPKLMRLPSWANWVFAALALILVLKELLPATWFGMPGWRTTIRESYGVILPRTHHPEPGRALDGWLVGAVGVLWFSWVRALSLERDDRVKVAWGLFIAAVIVALVSFGFSSVSKDSIFGLRFTPEWFGFGPFPNRNHTGTLLAMGVVVGIGCVAHAGSRKRFDFLCTGVLAIGVLMAALLRTQSRGALLALGVGVTVFLVAVVVKVQSKKAASIALAVAFLLGGFALIAGGKTLARFTSSPGVRDDSTAIRRTIWRDTWKMSKDAPLLGYGAGEFASVFPFYQDLDSEDVMVKHPESSVLQWWVELGAIPLLLGGALVGAFILPHARSAFERRSSFFLAAGGFGAATVLLVHSFIDVPAHRWGTAGFALAALALACPVSYEAATGSRRAAFVPLGVAAFWLLPLFVNAPAWSPFQLDRVLSAGAMDTREYGPQIDASLKWFPLNPKLRLLHAKYLEMTGAPPAQWQNEFRVAARLLPASSTICTQIARHCERVSPSLALHYWQLAVERASMHRADVFRHAVEATLKIPGAESLWESYMEANPDLMLLYAENRKDRPGKPLFDAWWERRGSKPEPLSPGESTAFLVLAEQWGTADQVATWVKLHGNEGETDLTKLVSLLHKWKADRDAWDLLIKRLPEPEYPRDPPGSTLSQLEETWNSNPGDVVNARNYAQALELGGQSAKAEDVIVRTARDSNAPKWFLGKAAYCLARREKFRDAVELALGSLSQ